MKYCLRFPCFCLHLKIWISRKFRFVFLANASFFCSTSALAVHFCRSVWWNLCWKMLVASAPSDECISLLAFVYFFTHVVLSTIRFSPLFACIRFDNRSFLCHFFVLFEFARLWFFLLVMVRKVALLENLVLRTPFLVVEACLPVYYLWPWCPVSLLPTTCPNAIPVVVLHRNQSSFQLENGSLWTAPC